MKKTTVIIPNYNGKHFLQPCLDALVESEGAKCGNELSFSVVIVDNGSSDGSVSYIRENYPWVEIIKFSQNRGFPAAVNAGIKASTSPYVLLLNNDTEVEKDFVKALEEELDQHPDVFSASAKMVSLREPEIMDGAGDFYTVFGWGVAAGKGKAATDYTKGYPVFSACAGAAIYRREKFGEIGLFDEAHFAYLEDMDVGYRAQIYGYRNYYVPKAVVKHAGSGSSGSRYNEFKIDLSARNNVYLIAKNMPLIQMLINLPFLFLGFLIKFLFFVRKGYGKTYAKGLCKGIKLSFSKEGRTKKVKFVWTRLGRYVRIELELFYNLRFFIRG